MQAFIDLIHDMSPYLLLGFLIAGLLHAFVPGRLYSQYLSGRNLRSVLLATLFGIPLPLCSCGVIPTAMSLRREGASKGATTAFLIATPQTGVDSIIATFALLGLPFSLLRPLAALVTAVAGGWLANQGDQEDDTTTVQPSEAECTDHCCAGHTHDHHHGIGGKVLEALRYGFVDMMADIGKWLVIGLVVAGLITVFVPTDFFGQFVHSSLLSMLLVLLLSIPMYLCATGSIPIAVALMLKGLSPGAALVLLMAGPASNMASILVVRKVLGTRTLIIYLGAIITGAVLFGLGIDYLLPREWFISSLGVGNTCTDCHHEPSLFSWISTITLTLLLINALFVQPLLRRRKPAAPVACTARSYRIEGMTCNHCRQHAEQALRSVPGVTTASVCLDTATAQVEGTASEEDLRKAVGAIGFTLQSP